MFGTVGLIISGTISTFANGIVFFTIARFFVMFFTGGKHRLINFFEEYFFLDLMHMQSKIIFC